MITHLEIKNFAIIKELKLDLKPGLNILTGETGAGKSIIIEALSMALGARADNDYIRTGEQNAEITMVIDAVDEKLLSRLESLGVPPYDPIIISRQLSLKSHGLCRINGTIVAQGMLQEVCKSLADIHGQYDHQSLLDPDQHIEILDLYGGESTAKQVQFVGSLYKEYIDKSTELMNIRRRLQELKRQHDLLKFELSDIVAAALLPGEDEELEAKIDLMKNSEAIYEAISAAHQAIYAERGAMEGLSEAADRLKSVENFSSDIQSISTDLQDIYYKLDDLNGEIRKLRDGTSYSEDELNEAIERLDLINSMKKKYGGSIEAVLEYAEQAKKDLQASENADERMAELEKEIMEAKNAYDKEASKLTELRKKTAAVIEKSVNKELKELNFKSANFVVNFGEINPTSRGVDSIEFMISANKGEDVKPLAKVASGGELSRIMLALKRIIGDLDQIPTMVFDEIDTGISGATAGIVGEKMKAISKDHQIICITHLPQIACLGDYHYRIEKKSDEISTQTTIVPLEKDARIEEIARMLSGTEITEAARQQAKALLDSAQKN